jgi:hypothetical protein
VARLKAASIINNIELARELLGEPRLGELLATVPEATRALFERRLYAVEWLESEDWLPFQTAMLERYFAGDEGAFRAYARKVCERDFNTFYKVIIRFLVSPESLLERTAKLWSTYSDEGTLAVVDRAREGGRQRVSLRLDAIRTTHPVFGLLLHGFVEQLLRMSGARAAEATRPLNQLHDGVLRTEIVAAYS